MSLPPRIKPGDRVFVRGWPPVSLEVIDCTSDPSIVTLRSEYGAVVKVGRLAVIPSTEQTTPGRLQDDGLWQ